MKILRDTLTYIGKNLIFVLGFAMLPACFIGGVLKPFSMVNFIIDYKNLAVNNFADILSVLFGVNWVGVINSILALILIVVVFSAFFGNMENHFKSGKLALSNTANFINNTVLIVLTYTSIFLISYAVIKFAYALIVFIMHIVFGCLGFAPTLALFIVNVVLTVLAFAILCYLLAFGLVAIVDTIICGYSVGTSFSDAGDLLTKKFYKVMFLAILPFVVVLSLIICGYMFGFSVIANIASLAILFMYYPVLGFTMYFDISRLARYDNIKRYYY